MTDWNCASLKSLGRIVTGKTPPTSVASYFGSDIPFITPTDMDGRRIIDRSLRGLSEKGAELLRSSVIPPHSIMVSCIGSDMGKAAIACTTCCTNQQINTIVVDPEYTDPFFIYYNLSGRKDEIRGRASGAAQPILNKSDFGNLQIKLPPLSEQRTIASVLSALDDKIELNRRMNETLEQMAQAIFKDWFVDFGPVRRKQDGARNPIAIMGGLVQDAARASELAALFPETFGDDGLPEGYSLVEVDRFAELRGGKQLNKSEIYENGSIPVFGGAGLMGYTKLSNADGYIITVGRVGAYCGQFFAHRGEAWVNNNASRIICRDPRFSEWLFWALKNLDINAIKKGAAQPFVSNGDIAKLKILFPGEETLVAFLGFLNPLLLLCEAQYSEIKTLSETRDYLLPKLMSGEVRVRDTEKYCLKS